MTNTIAVQAHQFSKLVAAEVRVNLARSGLTAEAAAEAIGMTPPALTGCLSGASPFMIDDLAQIARVVGTSPAELVRNAVRPVD